MVGQSILLVAGIIICQRVLELYLANRNKAAIIKLGAAEYGARHYPLFFVLHICWLFGWITEAMLKGKVSEVWYIWLVLFLFAQILRYWCIRSLGRLWNTRILVIPGTAVVQTGPYRYINHPNYLAVAIELLCVSLLFDAIITAVLGTLFNCFVMSIRLPEEKKALRLLKKVCSNK